MISLYTHTKVGLYPHAKVDFTIHTDTKKGDVLGRFPDLNFHLGRGDYLIFVYWGAISRVSRVCYFSVAR